MIVLKKKPLPGLFMLWLRFGFWRFLDQNLKQPCNAKSHIVGLLRSKFLAEFLAIDPAELLQLFVGEDRFED
jgi:hypothetical protein